MGLGFYEDELRKWLKYGAIDLMNASSADIEREINLKSPLHRKKITLALMEITGKDTDESFLCAAKLDIVWVIYGWLIDRNCRNSFLFFRGNIRLCVGWMTLDCRNIKTHFQMPESMDECYII